jgi:hypothetical protein
MRTVRKPHVTSRPPNSVRRAKDVQCKVSGCILNSLHLSASARSATLKNLPHGSPGIHEIPLLPVGTNARNLAPSGSLRTERPRARQPAGSKLSLRPPIYRSIHRLAHWRVLVNRLTEGRIESLKAGTVSWKASTSWATKSRGCAVAAGTQWACDPRRLGRSALPSGPRERPLPSHRAGCRFRRSLEERCETRFPEPVPAHLA